MTTPKLASKFRAPVARGLQVSSGARVDRANKVIHGYAVMTGGEALGHSQWIDGETLDSVVVFGNSTRNGVGIKSRFTHPGLCADGLGKYLGRARNFSRDGNVVRADLHLSDVANDSPDGELANYVMRLAESDPGAFGTSIVFEHDGVAERKFITDNGGRFVVNEWGEEYVVDFVSPDPDNRQNFIHIRIAELLASDVVDEPAANPGGFFSNGEELAARAETVFSFLCGLSQSTPDSVTLGGIDPHRAKSFFVGFLQRHSLALTKTAVQAGRNEQMGNDKQPEVPPTTPAVDVAKLQLEAVENFKAAEGKRLDELTSAFKDRPEFAFAAFAAGKTVEQAKAEFADVRIKELESEVAQLKSGKPSAPKLGAEPVAFSGGEQSGQSFNDLVAAYRAEHKCSFSAAAKAVARAHPGTYEKSSK